ncbi:MAG: rod shape-determining protein MreD [Gemmatimonadota bacterium]
MAVRTGLPFWIFIAVLVIAHLVLHVAIGLTTSAPDLMTVAVLLAARRLQGAAAAALGLLLGVLTDALSLTTFGALALVNAVIGFFGARSRDLFEGDSLLFVAVYIFLGKWLRDALYFGLTRSAQAESWSMLITAAPIAAVFAAIAAMIAIMLYRAATGER